MDCRTNEEWFVCESCGWGYQTKCRRFGTNTLSELRDITNGSQLHEAWPLVDSILRTLLSECNKHRDDEGDSVLKIQGLLARDVSERTDTDVEFVEALASYISLFAMEDGRVVLDYIEEPPRIMKIRDSELRSMSEIDEILWPQDREVGDGEDQSDEEHN